MLASPKFLAKTLQPGQTLIHEVVVLPESVIQLGTPHARSLIRKNYKAASPQPQMVVDHRNKDANDFSL